ncbi:hypothetical protein JOQ06_009264, partial [Pogonophryne albipinna]
QGMREQKNISVHRVGAPANNSRSLAARLVFDALLSGPHKAEEHNQSSVREGLAGLSTTEGSLNTGRRQTGGEGAAPRPHIHSPSSFALEATEGAWCVGPLPTVPPQRPRHHTAVTVAPPPCLRVSQVKVPFLLPYHFLPNNALPGKSSFTLALRTEVHPLRLEGQVGPLLTEQGDILQELGDGLQPQCQLLEKAWGSRGKCRTGEETTGKTKTLSVMGEAQRFKGNSKCGFEKEKRVRAISPLHKMDV